MYDIAIFDLILTMDSVVGAEMPILKHNQDGRVVKALDLRSNGHMSAWVRTPLLVNILVTYFNK
jgi:hypothetical protein